MTEFSALGSLKAGAAADTAVPAGMPEPHETAMMDAMAIVFMLNRCGG